MVSVSRIFIFTWLKIYRLHWMSLLNQTQKHCSWHCNSKPFWQNVPVNWIYFKNFTIINANKMRLTSFDFIQNICDPKYTWVDIDSCSMQKQFKAKIHNVDRAFKMLKIWTKAMLFTQIQSIQILAAVSILALYISYLFADIALPILRNAHQNHFHNRDKGVK